VIEGELVEQAAETSGAAFGGSLAIAEIPGAGGFGIDGGAGASTLSDAFCLTSQISFSTAR
jgi:hypothetical protein